MPRQSQAKAQVCSPSPLVGRFSLLMIWAFVTLMVGMAVLGAALVLPAQSAARMDDSAVRLPSLTGPGWGSGVAIGPHWVVTAAHVVNAIRSNILIVQVGAAKLRGEVLWINRAYDLALIEVPGKKSMRYRNVFCGDTYPGQDVTTSGYPSVSGNQLDGAITTKGVVSSGVQHTKVWRDYVLVDALGTMGASGSGVLDTAGRIVGIFVGISGASHPDGQGGEIMIPSGYNMMVPSRTLCRLLGR